MDVELIIRPRWLAPVGGGPPGRVLGDHAVAVDQGRIVALGPAEQLAAAHRGATVLDRPQHLLIPGLINAHTHAGMSLLRGFADDLPLMPWLQDHIWPAEGRWVSDGFVHDGTRLAIAEMLLGGTTCFQDMYFFPDAVARAVSSAGMRARLGLVVLDFPSAWADGPDAYLSRGLAVHDEYRDHPLISASLAPHAPYTVGDETLSRVRALADELDVPVHIHLHETAAEVATALSEDGRRPLARLDALGLVSPNLTAVHLTQLEDDEIRLLADRGVRAVHCPESNLKLASGAAPIAQLLGEGVTVALGTDGAASNNDLDMIGEMRSAALLAKHVSADASALPASEVLHMATLGGAAALGYADEIGSIEVGKAADLCCVDLAHPATSPCYDPVAQLVYAASRDQVSDTWVAGRHLVADGELTRMDRAELMANAGDWAARIAEARG